MPPHVADPPRSDYVARHGLYPVSTVIEVARGARRPSLDAVVRPHYTVACA